MLFILLNLILTIAVSVFIYEMGYRQGRRHGWITKRTHELIGCNLDSEWQTKESDIPVGAIFPTFEQVEKEYYRYTDIHDHLGVHKLHKD